MKRAKGFLIVAIMLSAFIIFSGFSATPDKGLIFKGGKKEYAVEDVTLEFCFGFHIPQSRRHDETRYNEHIILLFSNKEHGYVDNGFYESPLSLTDANIFFIREIPADEFYSEEYAFEGAGFNCRGKKDVYNHSEKITIPKEAFDKEDGIIVFHVKIELWDISGEAETFDGSGGESLSVRIYYKRSGNKVKIE